MDYHRRSIRLNGFDYSNNGYYFVTVCVQNRENLFGEINNGQMILNEIGKNIEKIFFDYFKNKYFKMDEYILMQDHFHIIIMIDNKYDDVGAGLLPALNENNERVNNENNERATTRVAPTTNKTLGKIIGELKSIITNEYIKNVKIKNWPRFDKRLWQRDYYERIIRNEKEYLKIKEYINRIRNERNRKYNIRKEKY